MNLFRCFTRLSLYAHICVRRFTASTLVAALVLALIPTPVSAATEDVTFELHPHCAERDDNDEEWVFGPIPSPGIVANTRGDATTCSNFESKDERTLMTRPLDEGDILDIDLVIHNPSKQHIQRARVWLSYDPNLLEGIQMDISSKFPVVTPDEKDFSESEGYAKMEASAEGSGPRQEQIVFAHLQFRVKKKNAIGTPITFHDTQPGGHTVVMTKEGESEAYVLKEEGKVLLVQFTEGSTDGLTEEVAGPDGDSGFGNIFDDIEEAIPDPPENPAEPEPEEGSCIRDEDCPNGTCINGQCSEQEVEEEGQTCQEAGQCPNGERCSEDRECASGLCGSGLCIPNLSETPKPMPPVQEQNTGRTAFSLLQVQNLRATTEGSSIFAAWDHLQSSQLKAYNLYYGTTSGRYIQRRTIDKTENSLTLRSLVPGTKYFLAVRALSVTNEESAFSREVSVIVGDPDSSTAPLTPGSITDALGQNPIASVTDPGRPISMPGETGAASTMMLFFLGSAIVGTAFASKRQLAVTDRKPHA